MTNSQTSNQEKKEPENIDEGVELYDEFLQVVEEGEKGLNRGLPMGLKKLDFFLNGIQKKRYDLVFASEGCGKSAFVANSYVMSPFEYWYNNQDKGDIHIRWYSLEVDAISVMGKLAAWKIYNDTTIITDTNSIFSKGRNRIPKLIKNQLINYKDYFSKFLDKVHIYDRTMSPKDIRDDIRKFAETRGRFFYDKKGLEQYRPNNPKEHVIIITDTLGNLKVTPVDGTHSKKGTIDYHSAICRDFYRNTLGYTVVNVMHSNRSISSTDRARWGEIFPSKSDIKDSGQPSADANTVIALFNPYEYANPNNNLFNFMKYDIKRLGERCRIAGILKNREGPNNARVAMKFLGEMGYFEELKKSSDMEDEDYKLIEQETKVLV